MSAGATLGRSTELARLGPPYLGLVIVEFLLGMVLNLFVELPAGSPSSILAASPLLDGHIVVGFLLLGIAANSVRLAAGTRSPPALAVTGIGLVSGLGAFAAGLAFAFGSQSALASLAMSVGFIGLLAAAGYLMNLRARLLASRPVPSTAPATGEA